MGRFVEKDIIFEIVGTEEVKNDIVMAKCADKVKEAIVGSPRDIPTPPEIPPPLNLQVKWLLTLPYTEF